MRNPYAVCAGGVLSADIAVPEHERELRFYSKVLTTGRTPLWREDLMNNRGAAVIGLGERTSEHDVLPLQWMPHIQVTDVGASAARALALGGSELMHGRDDQGRSQWAVLVDPGGAAFGIVPVADGEVELPAMPDDAGCIAWLTLETPDTTAACAFYEQVIGWSPVPSAVPGGFEMQRAGGVSVAEIRPPGAGGPAVPPVWILGLPVDDLQESVRRVREGGGEIIERKDDIGRALVRDPVGAYLALLGSG